MQCFNLEKDITREYQIFYNFKVFTFKILYEIIQKVCILLFSRKMSGKPNIEVNQKDIIYLINQQEKTASIINGTKSISKELIIPRAIINDFEEYIVTSISNNSFKNSYKVNSIQFAPDSKLRTIKKDAFSESSITSISLPASVTELDEGWCSDTYKLNNIKVDERNPRYSCINDEIIVGKSDESSEDFDILVFAVRKIRQIIIPSSIKIIASNAFEFCRNLMKVEFLPDSQLQIVNQYAFYQTYISSINIPPHVKRICDHSFSGSNLKNFNLPENSELQIIDDCAISGSPIEYLFIPASLTDLKDGWCLLTRVLNKVKVDPRNPRYASIDGKVVVGKSDESNENYDILVFAARGIAKVKIPSSIKVIASNAFEYCRSLASVEIPPDSQLQIINESAFTCTPINRIVIPSHVTHICRGVFHGCEKLSQIVISPNSELKMIDQHAFLETQITSLSIPASLTYLNEKWCSRTRHLNKIEVDPLNPRYSCLDGKIIFGKSDESNENYDILVFAARDIAKVKIPSSIKVIASNAFEYCRSLASVEIPPDLQLQIINESAFSFSSISSLFIPSQVKQICKSSFSACEKLEKVEIPSDSQIQTIGESAFCMSSIKSIIIPPHISEIHEFTFNSCIQLEIFEIDENSEMQEINIKSFPEKGIIMIPVQKVHMIKSDFFY